MASLIQATVLASALALMSVSSPEVEEGPTSPGPTSGHRMVFDTRVNRVLLYAGIDTATGYRSRLWGWDGASWTALAVDGPPGREDAQVAFDSRRGVLVLFGGRRRGATISDLTLLSDTWEWDGSRWRHADVSGPAPRTHAGMVYDAARRATVLFGGFAADGVSMLRDTWEWDGASWVRREDGPDRRWVNALAANDRGVFLHAAVRDRYDRATSTAPGEVWRWTGTWERADAAPPIDPQTPTVGMGDTLLVYFGWKLDAAPETWSWKSDAGWKSVTGDLPPRRRNTAMAYDPVRRRTVLYGGATGAGDLADLWEFDGKGWRRVL